MIPLSLHPRPVRTLGQRHRMVLVAILVVLTALIINIALRDYVVTWDGLVPAGPVDGNCGDYCGSGAGLISGPAQ